MQQPEPGALLSTWIEWIAEPEDEQEGIRRVFIAGGQGAEPHRLVQELNRRRDMEAQS